ncbi:MAG TPA: hypothetical protein VN523_04800 [Hyphomicrobiaceae bacterium]|nr:hypothetical protein [Hyphomicrobiaceae bacterium]
MSHRCEVTMRPALLSVCVLAAAGAAPAAALAAGMDPVPRTAPSLWHEPGLLAQRQPGGLPGRSDSDEEGRPGAKQLPGGAPDRAQQPAAPVTRSLQNPKPRGRSDTGPEPTDGTDKKAPRRSKNAPDKGN